MSNILLVPVHLDALVLDHDQMVVETTADFSRLPYCFNKYDINPDIANISEELVATPFQNENLLLKAGIHLHWSLPDALTKAQYVRDASGTGRQVFPPVPNRWLVTRCDSNNRVQKEWVVESDFLHPKYKATDDALLNAAASVVDGVAVPYQPEQGQPFRFMGRSVDVSRYTTSNPHTYYPELTAVGYGEPTFAAFYPNCYSVFGFFDEEYSGRSDGRLYYLIGWYSNQAQDVLRTHAKSEEELKDIFKWTIAPERQPFPTRMLCYARLELGTPAPKLRSSKVTVAVGNTGTEALSACLTTKLLGAKKVVEDHLEAMHMSATLGHRQLDVGPKFSEARHEKGFMAVSGGSLWTVRAASDDDAAADATETPAQITLPPELGSLLNNLNKRQSDYDRAWQQIESERVQLFSDWYKYMLCAYPPEDTRDAYPDVDLVAKYIGTRSESLEARIARAGKIKVTTVDKGRVEASDTSASARAGFKSAAATLAIAINNLQAFIDKSEDGSNYKLKETSGPRYWQPTEPSILLNGELAEASIRHGHDTRGQELLKTQLFTGTDGAIDVTNQNWREKIRKKLAEIADPKNDFAFSTWTGQPWNPFLLEWVVEVSPLANKSNIDPTTGRFPENFITDNYQLAENDVDLSLKPGKDATTRAANLYSGRSILTPHAAEQLVDQTEEYLEREVLPKYLGEANGPGSANGRAFLRDNMSGIEQWYRKRAKSVGLLAAEPEQNRDPNLTAFGALNALKKPQSLSQSLSGFNDALLMHKQTPQLHIADPLGFDDYQTFANLVGVAVSNSIYSAPTPQNDFNPIRTGIMKIHRLRLVDTFGQVKDLDVSKIQLSDPLDDGSAKPVVSLPPRLMQPARINFRWLAADGDEEEMNDHPATTPICGWVLANHLDNSLMVYDNQGRALGSVMKKDAAAKWESAPGGLGVDSIKDISNPHLQKIVRTILEWDHDSSNFLDDFITAIDSAVQNIEPENFTHHQDLALLMGRPLALVRASVNLELKGLPATHQGWNEFRQDMQRAMSDDQDGRGDDNGFTRVRFPIRIGEYKQFNDGTVGYWKEKDGKYEDDAFFAPQSDDKVRFKGARQTSTGPRHLKTHKTDPEAMVFFQTVQAPPQILTLLMDPRGVVHATSGIVPAKAINIPPDQYAAALQAIEITFLSTPVLTDAGKIHLPLPDEAGYQWSWLQQNLRHEWSEVSTRGLVRKQTFVETFGSDAPTIWAELCAQRWIDLVDEEDDTRASVIARDKRSKSPLDDSVMKHKEKIEDILDRAHIGPVDPTAKFSGQQEVREGWLKLSPAPVAQPSSKDQTP